MRTSKRRFLCRGVLCLLLLLALLSSLVGCGLIPPKMDELYDRVVELVEGSKELNTVFYGAGLPVYARDSEYAELNHIYFQHPQPGYETVSPYAKFLTVADIQAAAEKIYSRAYLEEVLYVSAFTGHAFSDGAEGAVVAGATYLEDTAWIYRSETAERYPVEMRVYDYSTMRITRPSNRKAVYVTLDAYPEAGGEAEEVRLRLVKQEDGRWYLDSFTG